LPGNCMWQPFTFPVAVLVIFFAILPGLAAAQDAPSADGILPFDHQLARLMNQFFCQTTPLLRVDIYDALPEAWTEEERRGLPVAVHDRRRVIGRHYGLTPTPPDVQEFPLGLVAGMTAGRAVLHANCLLCHSGELFGQPVVGLANNRLDFEALMDDVLTVSQERRVPLSPWAVQYRAARRYGIRFNTTPGSTSPLSFASIFLALRNADLTHRQTVDGMDAFFDSVLASPLARRLGAETLVRRHAMFGMPDIDQDAPSWWLTRADSRLFVDGLIDKGGPSTMMFLADPWIAADEITDRLPHAREFVAHLDRVPPPPSYADAYPERVDAARVTSGSSLFAGHCGQCHGVYGSDPATDKYPGRIVALAEIGTDSRRATGITDGFRAFLDASWFGQQGALHTEMRATGYRAPYLRRVAYTFPYLHNGSIPTLYHVLFPEERPDRWQVDPDHYDHDRLGQQVDPRGREPATARERRMIFDTSLPGKGKDGHDTILEPLSRAERLSILEYLKTL